MGKTLEIQEIMTYLPHRYPFILVDRIVDIMPGKEVIALKNVTINEPFFQGHFPGIPVMPGVLIIEAMAQAGGVLAYESAPGQERGSLIYFMGIDKVKFRKPVVPGDQLSIHVKMLKLRKTAVKMAGTAAVDNKLVAEAEFMATLGERK